MSENANVPLSYWSKHFFSTGSVPAEKLDVWYAEQGSDFRVYWKVSVQVSFWFLSPTLKLWMKIKFKKEEGAPAGSSVGWTVSQWCGRAAVTLMLASERQVRPLTTVNMRDSLMHAHTYTRAHTCSHSDLQSFRYARISGEGWVKLQHFQLPRNEELSRNQASWHPPLAAQQWKLLHDIYIFYICTYIYV